MNDCRNHPDEDGIFGDTYHGVPNPLVPHRHPYPTRYHGTMLWAPRFMLPYVERPYARPPFAGEESQSRPPLFSSLTNSTIGDAAVGAAFGYLIAPGPGERGLWTGIGGVATMLAGTLGLLGTAGLAFMSRSRRAQP
jgi:hypothetical protein